MSKDKCNHYSDVDEGWYCWKCLEREKRLSVEQERRRIVKEINRGMPYALPVSVVENIVLDKYEVKEVQDDC